MDVEILKNEQVTINIDNMRLIQLMNPAFQMSNKLTGKRILENAEITNTVAEEQHRSRKHHQAGLLTLNKAWIGDLSRVML